MFPLNATGGMEVQLLYLAGDFSIPSAAPAGNIVSWSFFISPSYPLGPWTYTNFTIAMGQANINTLPTGSFYTGSMTTVYNHSSVSLSAAGGTWLTITLDTPFPYDPTQALIVAVGQCSCPSASGWSNCFASGSNNRRIWSGMNAGCPYSYSAEDNSIYVAGITLGVSCTPPTVTTLAATAITSTGATLNGTVNANGCSTTVTFQYGLTTAYGSTVTATQSPVTGNTATAVSAAVSGLSPCTLYHYRCVGVNSGNTIYGSDMTFTTTCGAPTVVTQAATAITANSATLNGTVNANNSNSNTSFDYGLTVAYGTNLPGVPASVSGATPTAV